MSVFIGGRTKSYRIEPEEFKKWLSALKSSADKTGYELLVTTSRRTDAQLSAMTKESFAGHPSCKLLIVANESTLDSLTANLTALNRTMGYARDVLARVSQAHAYAAASQTRPPHLEVKECFRGTASATSAR